MKRKQQESRECIDRASSGFTLLELMVVVVVVGVISVLAVPALNQTSSNQRLRDSAMALSGLLSLARGEAIRTGNVHIVFLGQDTLGNTLQDVNGTTVPMLMLDDGRPGSANQNCEIDSGEITHTVGEAAGVDVGLITGTAAAPSDLGTGDIMTGTSFLGPNGLAASWVLFRPEGAPLSFDATCATGAIGSGAGAFYLTNGTRNAAVVLLPMGTVRVHGWSGGWNN